jgi:hypothetical protein
MLKNDSYAQKELKDILSRLGLPVSILIHLGRKIDWSQGVRLS